MSEFKVRIVELEPMRVASAYGFGEQPEGEAWGIILGFAASKGIDVEGQRFFGFNNPDPSPGSPNYGYEQWMIVGPDVEPEGEVRIEGFGGGLYAVAHCESLSVIGEVWKQLVQWWEESDYKKGQHQWLEELLCSPHVTEEEFVFDLYLPIAE